MDTVTILRDLWRLRCSCLGVTCSPCWPARPSSTRSRSRRSSRAASTRRRGHARILVDTPSSQVVEVAPKGSDTLGVRANLLASLMVDGTSRRRSRSRRARPERTGRSLDVGVDRPAGDQRARGPHGHAQDTGRHRQRRRRAADHRDRRAGRQPPRGGAAGNAAVVGPARLPATPRRRCSGSPTSSASRSPASASPQATARRAGPRPPSPSPASSSCSGSAARASSASGA